MKKWTLIGGWVLVLAVTTAVTWQIVSAADAQVSDAPAALNVSPPAEPSSTGQSSSTSQTRPSQTSVPGNQTSNSNGGKGSTSSSSSVTSTPTTPGTAEWKLKTIPTGGGTVVVTYRPGEVLLQTATPKSGYRAEIDKTGPDTVEVEFDSDETSYEVKVEWDDGALDIEIDAND